MNLQKDPNNKKQYDQELALEFLETYLTFSVEERRAMCGIDDTDDLDEIETANVIINHTNGLQHILDRASQRRNKKSKKS